MAAGRRREEASCGERAQDATREFTASWSHDRSDAVDWDGKYLMFVLLIR